MLNLVRMLRAEFFRQLYNPLLYILLFVLIATWTVATLGTLFVLDTPPSPLATGQIIQSLTATIWPLCILLHATTAISPDRDSGALAFWLAKPSFRLHLFCSRYASSMIFLLGSILIIHLLTWLVLSDYGSPMRLLIFGISKFIVFLPLVSLGLFISSLRFKQAAAIVASLGSYFIIDLASVLFDQPLFFSALFHLPFEAYYDTFLGFPISLPNIPHLVCLMFWIILPAAVGLTMFCKRDVL